MAKVDGGALFGQALKNEGIETAFVLTGGHIMPILYGLRRAGIDIIDMRHECSALYAAIAYTRASGKIAAVVTTAGPGVGNTPAGMMEAESMAIPLLHIGGAVAMSKRDAGDLQDMSTLTLMESCSKWARKITSTQRIPEYVSMALRNASAGAPGPVYLEVPTDLLSATVDDDGVQFPVASRTRTIPLGDPAAVDEVAAQLARAQRPAMIFDEGARWTIGEHGAAVAELSDYLKMPIGVVGSSCRGQFGDEAANPLLRTNAIAQADLVIAMGCKFDFRLGFGKAISPQATVVQVHTDARQIGYNLRADIGIVGGTGPVARQMLDAVKARRAPNPAQPWTGAPQRGTAALPEPYHSRKSPTHPARCAGDVARFLEEDARDWNIVCDGGEASVWMNGAATARRAGQIHSTGANGTIGTGPCLAIGAWAANGKPVLWYTGDGSFGFYAMEMDTMARQGIPVICVISNDSAWGMIRLVEGHLRRDEVEANGHCANDLAPMRDYDRMAQMWGGYGEKVTEPDEIIPAIRRARTLGNGRPSIINVQVDDVSLSPFIAGYANMVAPAN